MENQRVHRQGEKLILIIICLLGWFALGLQLYLIVNKTIAANSNAMKGVVNFFSYFTILTNLLVTVAASSMIFSPKSKAGRFFQRVSVRTAICAYILIVGIVYINVLQNVWDPTGAQLLADVLLHYAIPAIYFLYWLIYVPANSLAWKNVFNWLIYPFVYLVYAILRGVFTGWFAYPFLDTNELAGSTVIINCLLIACGFLLMSLMLLGLKRLTGNLALK